VTGGLRFRVFIGEGRPGDLPMVAEDWVGRPGDEDGALVAQRHGALCRQADATGKRWRLEVWDPEDPETPLWFGSDSAGMVMPIRLHPNGLLFNPN
jgi:hypothetical protein